MNCFYYARIAHTKTNTNHEHGMSQNVIQPPITRVTSNPMKWRSRYHTHTSMIRRKRAEVKDRVSAWFRSDRTFAIAVLCASVHAVWLHVSVHSGVVLGLPRN